MRRAGALHRSSSNSVASLPTLTTAPSVPSSAGSPASESVGGVGDALLFRPLPPRHKSTSKGLDLVLPQIEVSGGGDNEVSTSESGIFPTDEDCP